MPEVDTYKSLMPKGLLVASVEIGSDRVFIVAHTASEACTCPMDMRHCGSTNGSYRRLLASEPHVYRDEDEGPSRVWWHSVRCRRLDRLPYLP
jgi:hypothetical protein